MAQDTGLARRSHPKYDDQVWAGLVKDPERLAQLQAERAPKKVAKPAPAAAVDEKKTDDK